MERLEKEQLVQELREKFENAKSFFLTDFSGLNVEQITELRSKFRESSVEYKVVKNTLTKLALQHAGYDKLLEYMLGPTAVAYSYNDPVAPARIISDFLKTHREIAKPEIKVCVVEKEIISAEHSEDLVNLPNRETLIAMVLGGINAPITGFVQTLNGVITKLVLALKAIEEKKNES